ncbi:MAG: hypothetical protein WBP43_10740, partial [Chitinophagales bacterium]
ITLCCDSSLNGDLSSCSACDLLNLVRSLLGCLNDIKVMNKTVKQQTDWVFGIGLILYVLVCFFI